MDTINNFFAPLEHAIKKYQKYIRYVLYVLTFLSFGFLMMKNGTKESGEKAIFVLWVILWLPIFARVLDLGIARALMPLRKELGILMGTLALVHGFSFIIPNQSLLQDGTAVWGEGGPTYLFFGLIAMWLSVPLTLTSSSWAMRKMGKYWKYLHRLVYIIIIFVVVHVVLLKAFRGFEYGPVIILGLYFVGKILEWRGFTLRKSGTKTYPKGQKWICLPCGMIYDPVVGDIDGGVKPGTEFTDIPDSWRCPECGVTKADFVPYDPETDIATTGAIVKEKKMLNPTTIELTVETDAEIPSLPGQFMSLLWEDAKGKFPRSYSIAKQEGKVYTFLIKVGKGGRGGALLEKLGVGESMQVRTISGKFILLENTNPKIFIATGTGLAPIYRMIMGMDDDTRKSLYFSVSTEAELFYVDELRTIKNLDLHIHVTREKIDGYKEGRVNIDSIETSPDTEWYLCGNPQMVKDAQEKLNKRGFTRVYSEEF